MRKERGPNVPSRIVVSNRSRPRLDEIARLHAQIASELPVEYVLAPQPAANDASLGGLKPGSMAVNATGLGKDAPGSPISDADGFQSKGKIGRASGRERVWTHKYIS